MAFSYIASAKVEVDASGTTANMESALNVVAGDLLVAWVSHEEAATAVAIAKNAGGPANDFTFDAGDSWFSGTSLGGKFGYLLSAAVDATATFRVTWTAAKSQRRAFIYQFRNTGSTVSKDQSTGAVGASTAGNSGDITTTGTDEVVVGGTQLFNTGNTSAEQINDIAADGVLRAETGGTYVIASSIWYRIVGATFTGHAQCTEPSSDLWTCGVIAFKGTPSAPPRKWFFGRIS